MASEYRRKGEKFFLKGGLVLSRPIDLLQMGEYPYLKNIRSYSQGVIETRPGTTKVNSADSIGTTIHSVRQLNDDKSAQNIYVLGVGGDVRTMSVSGTTSTVKDTGYSGNPLSLNPFRPDQSPQSWMYIADQNRWRKIKTDGTNYPTGIAPPTTAPLVDFGTPLYGVVDNFNGNAAGSWAATGTGFTLDAVHGTGRTNTTITQIVYSTGVSGWCSIQPASMAGIGTGARIVLNASETVTVQGIYPSVGSTTISSIIYDSGTTGACSIVPSVPQVISSDVYNIDNPIKTSPAAAAYFNPVVNNQAANLGFQPASLLTINSGGGSAETVLVQSVSVGPDGQISFRCTAANTHAAGETITGLNAFRVYTAGTFAAGNTVTSGYFSIAAASSGTGGISETASFNLAKIGSNRLTNPDDEIHGSIRISDQTLVTSIRIMFDVDASSNNFTQNYYYYEIRPNDITPAVSGGQTDLAARKNAIINFQIDNFDPTVVPIDSTDSTFMQTQNLVNTDGTGDTSGGSSGTPTVTPASEQTTPGQSQWTEFFLALSDFTRVGADASRTWANVAAVKIQIIATGAVTVDVSSLFEQGAYGPDVGDAGGDYFWRYRYRSSATGARSQPSPAIRNGLRPHRQSISITPAVSSDAQVDRIDYFRFGGTLTAWTRVGTSANSASAFTDTFMDSEIETDEQLSFNHYQPFPVGDLPRTGLCYTSGTSVFLSADNTGDTFNTQWAPGTLIEINKQVYTLYSQPSATNKLEIIENAGTQGVAATGVPFIVPNGLILASDTTNGRLPVEWGPFGEGETALFLFSCGDIYNAGRLYWTVGNDPDSADESGWIDVSSPSEPLMNGCVWDDISWVASNKRWWAMIPSFDASNQFQAIEKPVGKGLFCRWGMAVCKEGVYFVGDDGIYFHQGNLATSITDQNLYPLFPHEGQPGVATTLGPSGSVTYYPPDYTQPNRMRLSYAEGYLYFDFLDISGAQTTLVYNTLLRCWEGKDLYTEVVAGTATSPAFVHYAQEGRGYNGVLYASTDGFLYKFVNTVYTDRSGTNISCRVVTLADDRGDIRAQKLWADAMADINPHGIAVSVLPGFDNYTLAPFAATIMGQSSRTVQVIDINSGTGNLARNMCFDISWSGNAIVSLYGWEFADLARPEDTLLRATDFDDDGHPGMKWLQGCVIEADTANAIRTVQVQGDLGALIATINPQHNGKVEIPYSWPGFYTHEMRLLPTDGNSWKLYKIRWIYEPAPELTTTWETPDLTLWNGYGHMREIYVPVLSTSVVTLTVTIDGTAYTYSIPAGTGTREVKNYLTVQPIKGLITRLKLTSGTGFRVFQQDVEIKAKGWNETGPYRILRPFGDSSVASGARI